MLTEIPGSVYRFLGISGLVTSSWLYIHRSRVDKMIDKIRLEEFVEGREFQDKKQYEYQQVLATRQLRLRMRYCWFLSFFLSFDSGTKPEFSTRTYSTLLNRAHKHKEDPPPSTGLLGRPLPALSFGGIVVGSIDLWVSFRWIRRKLTRKFINRRGYATSDTLEFSKANFGILQSQLIDGPTTTTTTLDQKSLEKVPDPRWVCFKLLVTKSRSCFTHLARTFGDVCGILDQTHTPIFTVLLVSFFGFQENAFSFKKCYNVHPKHPRAGTTFWSNGYSPVQDPYSSFPIRWWD